MIPKGCQAIQHAESEYDNNLEVFGIDFSHSNKECISEFDDGCWKYKAKHLANVPSWGSNKFCSCRVYSKEEIKETKLFEVFTPPFKYDEFGQTIFDSDNNRALDVRAWGQFQYKENGEELQNNFGEWVAECLNKNIK